MPVEKGTGWHGTIAIFAAIYTTVSDQFIRLFVRSSVAAAAQMRRFESAIVDPKKILGGGRRKG
jgi:hypothetical protein